MMISSDGGSTTALTVAASCTGSASCPNNVPAAATAATAAATEPVNVSGALPVYCAVGAPVNGIFTSREEARLVISDSSMLRTWRETIQAEPFYNIFDALTYIGIVNAAPDGQDQHATSYPAPFVMLKECDAGNELARKIMGFLPFRNVGRLCCASKQFRTAFLRRPAPFSMIADEYDGVVPRIMSCLPFGSVGRFRCVARRFSAAARSAPVSLRVGTAGAARAFHAVCQTFPMADKLIVDAFRKGQEPQWAWRVMVASQGATASLSERLSPDFVQEFEQEVERFRALEVNRNVQELNIYHILTLQQLRSLNLNRCVW